MTGARDDSAADKIGAVVGISVCSSITRAMAVYFIQRLLTMPTNFAGVPLMWEMAQKWTATPVGPIATADRRHCSMALEG